MNFTQTQRSTQQESLSQYRHSQRTDIFSKRSDSYMEEDPDLTRKADECVQYILFCCLSERKAIVRRADLNKFIIKDQSRQYKTIMNMVSLRLHEVFGIELIDINNDEKAEKLGIRTKFEYDLNLNRPHKSENANTESDPIFLEQYKYSMLMISLALIFMNENEISDELFWDSMKKLDINKEDKKHKYLGDIFKYFTTDLVKEGYLEYELIKGIEPPTYKFKTGYRSKLEITKKSILDFVCKVYGGLDVCKPEEWSTQYNDAMKESQSDHDEINEDEEVMEVTTIEKTQTSTTQSLRTQRTQRTMR